MGAATEQALQLRDIHLPPAPPLWPPAPGWWLLAGLMLALLALCGWSLARALRQRRRRRAMLARLDGLEQQLRHAPTTACLADVSALLKRLALQQHPRGEVAVLSGTAWLAFLDRTGGDGGFANGPGRVLADAGYHRDLPEALDAAGLMRAVRLWIRRNAGGKA